MASLVFAIISGPEHGWTSGRVLLTAAVAVVVLGAFAYWESRVPYPMLDLHFFRDRRFTGADGRPALGTPVSIALGMVLMSAGLVSIAMLDTGGYAGTLLGLLLIGGGCAIANPAMAYAIMSAIPPEKAGVGAGINGTLAEFGNGLGVAVLGAVLTSRVPSAGLAAGLETGQLVGAVAVLLGGVVAAALLRRAERADSGVLVA
jgi:hypothetical protein